jgi:hypothetical protein
MTTTMPNAKPMTKADLLKLMTEGVGKYRELACEEATKYVREHASDSAKEIGLTCDRPDWLVWFLSRYAPESVKEFAFNCADRAVRIYAPQALEKAGLIAEAERLRALPQIVDVETANAAAACAACAANATRAALAALAATYAAASARAAARTASAAYAATYATDTTAYAAERDLQLKELREIWEQVIAG